MLTLFVLFVGLTLATAVIAYWSDNLGKKLGKKRVSLWGLRPRTTATFLTIASSWVIMVFTLAVMLVIFPPLRQSLLRFDEVRAQERQLRVSKRKLDGQVGALNTQVEALQTRTSTLQNKVFEAAQKLAEVQGQLKGSQRKAQRARQARDIAQRDADAARRRAAQFLNREKAAVAREKMARQNLAQVTLQSNTTRAQRDAAKSQLSAAQSQLASASQNVARANAEVFAANARVTNANAAVARAETQYKTAQKNLSAVRADLQAAKAGEANARASEVDARTNAAIAQTNANDAQKRAENAKEQAFSAGRQALDAGLQVLDAQKQIAQAQARVAQLQSQSEQLRQANSELLAQNRAIESENQNVILENQTVLLSNVRVPVGRTVVARSFAAGLSLEDARAQLRALIESGAENVAGNKKEGKEKIVGLLPGASLQLAPLISSGNAGTLVTPNAILNNLADYIASSSDALSVRLVASRNHLAGEKTLYTRFVVIPIHPALADETELASTVLDGRLSDASLFSALLDLVDTGREFAGQNGVAPPLSPEAPDFYAPGSREQIFQILRVLDSINGPARVSILTNQPISTADQLRVRFDVKTLAPDAAPAT